MNDIVLYIKESYNELIHKVTWPTWPNLFANTRLVIIASIIISLIIFLMDTVANGTLKAIYNLNF